MKRQCVEIHQEATKNVEENNCVNENENIDEAAPLNFNKVSQTFIDRYQNYCFNSNDGAKEGGISSPSPSPIINPVSSRNDAPKLHEMKRPTNLVLGKEGTMYIAETFNHVIRKIESGGQTNTFVGMVDRSGSLDGQGTAARLHWPSSLCTDSKGRIFVTDSGNEAIRMIDQDGMLTTIAGCCGEPGHVDGKQNVARFCCPIGIICDEFDRLYVADAGNHCIRVITFNKEDDEINKVDPTDDLKLEVTTLLFEKEDEHVWPSALMVDSTSNVYILDKSSGHMSRITSDGKVIGDFEDYGEDRANTGTSDVSGFVIDHSGSLGKGKNAPPRAYAIEKMEIPMMERIRQRGTVEQNLLLEQPGAHSANRNPLEAFVMMSMPLDEGQKNTETVTDETVTESVTETVTETSSETVNDTHPVTDPSTSIDQNIPVSVNNDNIRPALKPEVPLEPTEELAV
mmetsp:Transcript_25349/g.30046  ORF Transcript_25349/g.30046 Transcript_25349/m.30046 type:complete len:455 (-) Transcript_25349:79-1443(-)